MVDIQKSNEYFISNRFRIFGSKKIDLSHNNELKGLPKKFPEIKEDTIDELLDLLADRYLGINCACFSPNENRKQDILRLVKEYKADGVVLYSLNFCQPYDIEAISLEKELKKAEIPAISITTDYSSEDENQLKTRIEAFLEML